MEETWGEEVINWVGESEGGVGLGLVHGSWEGEGILSGERDRLSVSSVRAGCWRVRWGKGGSSGPLLGE